MKPHTHQRLLSLLIPQAVADLKTAGKSEREIDAFTALFTEVRQQIDSKQLRPFIRTQYMRTAFQIPFDSTVRVSMDTNMCMIKENPDEGPSCTLAGRWYRWVLELPQCPCIPATIVGKHCSLWAVAWNLRLKPTQQLPSELSRSIVVMYCPACESLPSSILVLCVPPCRDPSLPINRNEITRFPHAVLEIKLSLGQGQESPAWVQVGFVVVLGSRVLPNAVMLLTGLCASMLTLLSH